MKHPFKLADKKEKQQRLKFCRKCKSSRHNLMGLTCGRLGISTDKTCGCLISGKIQFENSKCPQNKW